MQTLPENEGPGALVESASEAKGTFHISNGDTTANKPTPQRRWAEKNPKAVWAHAALRAALRRGLLKKGVCEVCGSADVDGHHDSYDTPMLVRWRCRAHHKQLHRELKAVRS